MHEPDELGPADFTRVEVAGESEKVADGREQTAVPVHVLERHQHVPFAVVAAPVSDRALLDDLGEIVPPLGLRHSEGAEDPLLRELVEGLSGHPLHEHRLEVVSGVRVGVVAARLVVEGALAARDVERVLVRVYPGRPRPAVDAGDRPPVAESARVMDEHPHRDGLAVVGHLGEVLPDVVVEVDASVQREQDRGRRGELFRDRARLEYGLGRVRKVPLEVRHAVCARHDLLSIARDREGAPGAVRRAVVREYGVERRHFDGPPGRIVATRVRAGEPRGEGEDEGPESCLHRLPPD